MHILRHSTHHVFAAALICALTSSAFADQGQILGRNVPTAYSAECAACHVAYPPGMLPTRSWQRIMAGLNKHFGVDASLDEKAVQQLSVWLQANAGTYNRVAEEPAQDRITRSAWFEREHRKIEPAVWKHASVKSASNCAACHTLADKGIYSEKSLRFPAGLDARYLKAWKD
jgi:hypothetical protein